jgi:hypothetical protein
MVVYHSHLDSGFFPSDKQFWWALNENRHVERFAKPIEAVGNNLFENGYSILKRSGHWPSTNLKYRKTKKGISIQSIKNI